MSGQQSCSRQNHAACDHVMQHVTMMLSADATDNILTHWSYIARFGFALGEASYLDLWPCISISIWLLPFSGANISSKCKMLDCSNV